MTICGILFDNDGTLVDTYRLILESFRYSTHKVLGRTIPDAELMAKVGQPLVTEIADFTDDPSEQDRVWNAYQAYNLEHHDAEVKAFAGIPEALETLRQQGYALGVVTSKRHELCARGLQITGLDEYFSCLVGKEDCPTFKPEPEPVLAGAAALGLPPVGCIYIGDSPYDLESGNAAGASTIAALWGMFPEDELAACHPDALCASPQDIPQVVEQLAARSQAQRPRA